MKLVQLVHASFIVVAVFCAEADDGNVILSRVPSLIEAARHEAALDPNGVQSELLQKLLTQPNNVDHTLASQRAAAAELSQAPSPVLNAIGYLGTVEGTVSIRASSAWCQAK